MMPQPFKYPEWLEIEYGRGAFLLPGAPQEVVAEFARWQLTLGIWNPSVTAAEVRDAK